MSRLSQLDLSSIILIFSLSTVLAVLFVQLFAQLSFFCKTDKTLRLGLGFAKASSYIFKNVDSLHFMAVSCRRRFQNHPPLTFMFMFSGTLSRLLPTVD